MFALCYSYPIDLDHPAIGEALTLEAYREIRKEDEGFGQEIGRIYRELPESERVAAFVALCVPYLDKTRRLYQQLFGIEDAEA